MCRGGDLGHFAEHLDIRRALVEVVVAHDGAEGLTTELAVLLFVDLLEDRALVPCRTLELLQRLGQIPLGNVHHADLQVLVGLGVVHHVVQAAPRTLELLVVGVVNDLVDLLRELGVDRGDHGLDRLGDVLADHGAVAQRLLREGEHRLLDGALGFVAAGFEFLLQQRREVIAGELDIFQRTGCCGGFGHGVLSSNEGNWDGNQAAGSATLSSGFLLVASVCSSAGSSSTLASRSSAPVLPSM